METLFAFHAIQYAETNAEMKKIKYFVNLKCLEDDVNIMCPFCLQAR